MILKTIKIKIKLYIKVIWSKLKILSPDDKKTPLNQLDRDRNHILLKRVKSQRTWEFHYNRHIIQALSLIFESLMKNFFIRERSINLVES